MLIATPSAATLHANVSKLSAETLFPGFGIKGDVGFGTSDDSPAAVLAELLHR